MPIISVRDNENNSWKKNAKKKPKQTKTEKNKGNGSYSERMKAKWFCCAFKLGFLQLICKVEFSVSFINYFKKKRIMRVRACYDGV